ncbi:hypothetical protein MNBD_PLANCTO03-150, partial [hydrothermal vent metagenome]
MRIQTLTLFLLATVTTAGFAQTAALQTARGVVFVDTDSDGLRDEGERGLAGIRVSNGRDVVLTDEHGRYEVEVDNDDIVFVIKPRGYATRIDELNLPRFYYIHKPAGSPEGLRYPGVAPTGPLPESIDFALTPQAEPDRFQTIFFGDTQPRNVQEVEYFAHDIVEDLIGFEGAFGVTLGDIVFDDLDVFEPHNQTVALIGMPWYNVLGNHDINFDVPDDALSDETFERVYGPATYSFDYGPVHYVVLDNVFFYRDREDKTRYRGGFSDEQMQFMVNDLAHVSKDQLVVYMMHIPLRYVPEKREFFERIKEYPYTLSIAGHTHTSEHEFFGTADGNQGPEHHHYIAVTACGSWWTGAPDERGIPHATMSDGAPNGYTIITFDGHGYSMEFRAASEPAKTQMRIWTPEVVSQEKLRDTEVVVNVFGGSPRSIVEMRVNDGSWTPLRQDKRQDPYLVALKQLEETDHPPRGRKLPKPGT